MRKNISLNEFHSMLGVINILRKLGLIDPFEYTVTWEKKPQLVINELGEFEFENPEELYGCVITFWDENGVAKSKTRFNLGG